MSHFQNMLQFVGKCDNALSHSAAKCELYERKIYFNEKK